MNRVKAIREDALVGSGSCTSIDECFTDKEVVDMLDEDSILTPRNAVVWARNYELLFLENSLNYRWGSDSDPELSIYRDFKNRMKANPVSV